MRARPISPHWLNSQGFSNVQGDYYWSSTTFGSTPGYAWIVSILNGFVGGISTSHGCYVLPVRSGQLNNPDPLYPANVWKTGQTTSYSSGDDGDLEKGVSWPVPRFTDHGDETITDNLTGLMWTKNANLAGGPKFWQEALDYVKSINSGAGLGGYHDWRLPNRKELFSLIDHSKSGPALPASHPFQNVQSDYYWLSTTFAWSPYYAWLVRMWDGEVTYIGYPYGKSFSFYAWPVRSGQGPTESVSAPTTLSGPTTGVTGTSYSFNTGGSTSSLGHTVEYQFDWKGDGSDLSPWGSATQSKTWTTAGTYTVKARARCATHTSVISGWTSGLTVTISAGVIGTPGTATRDLPDCYTPSVPSTVNIIVTPSVTANYYGVVETVPNGWTVSDINENGWWDNEFYNWVRWYFRDKNNRTLTYKATPPSGETGTKTFSGTAFFNEDVVTIGGDLILEKCSSETVSIPNTPSGPTSGTTGTSYTYSTGGSTSSLGHSVQYFIDWGDGTNSGWLPVGTTSASKSWTSAGSYSVKAQARCATDTSVASSWSGVLSVIISPQPYTLLTTSVNPAGAGIISLNPPGGAYSAGTAVTLTATANSGYSFSTWSGDLTGSTNPAQITMDGNKTVTAVFLLIKVEEDNPTITYTGTWNTYTSPSCSGGAMKYSGQKGAKAEFSFTGTGIKWIVTKAKMMGKAKVYLDGVYMGLVDLYSSSPAYQVVLQKAGLAPGNHTLRLEFSGQKNPRATGYYINIDAFEVIP